jgi:uncharacterized membrane protein YoaK (UPF0700 family)
MLVREGETRTPAIDLLLAASLAFVAGGVNSAGYIASGFFSANMTGNVSLISDYLSVREFRLALAFLAIVTMFILGALAASLIIQVGKSRGLRNIYALTLLAEAALLMAVGVYAHGSTWPGSGLTVAGLLSFAMGIQNAASTRISASRVRTTHVSGIATDIGVGLAMLLGEGAHGQRHETSARLKLHIVTILAFLVGGIVGVVSYGAVDGLVFSSFSIVLLLLCTRYIARPAQ